MEVIETKKSISILKKNYYFGELLTFFLNIRREDLVELFTQLTDEILSEIMNELILTVKQSKNPVIIETSNLKEQTINKELKKYFSNINPIYFFILISYVRSIGNNDRKSFTLCFFHDIETIQEEFLYAVNELINKSNFITYKDISKYNKHHRVDNVFENFKFETRTSYKLNSSSRSLQKCNEFYDLDSFLYYDFINLLQCALDKNTVLIKECRTCKKLFLTFKSDIAYCDNHRNDIKNRHYSYQEKVKNDIFYREYDKAYKRTYKRYTNYNSPDSLTIFENWKQEAKRILNLHNSNNISNMEFFNFFDKKNSPFAPENRKKYL